MTTFVVRPYISEDELWEGFCNVLLRKGLVDKTSMLKLSDVRPGVICHVIAKMHGTYMQIGSGRPIFIVADNNKSNLSVKALSRIAGEKDIYLEIIILSTSLSVENWCEGKFLPESYANFVAVREFWDTGLEVTKDMKLSAIQ